MEEFLEVHRNSGSIWIQAWERTGIAGLSEKSRSGAPSQHPYADINVIEQ